MWICSNWQKNIRNHEWYQSDVFPVNCGPIEGHCYISIPLENIRKPTKMEFHAGIANGLKLLQVIFIRKIFITKWASKTPKTLRKC